MAIIDDKIYGLTGAQIKDLPVKTKAYADGVIETEATARQTADNSLQAQIDAITASSDVVDVVDTKADLDDYDTTKLHDNDIVKVLEDETHSDAISYYRWGATAEEFSYIGSQGPFYTKSETDTLLNGKADQSTTYTKSEVDSALSGKADASNSYTKSEIDTALGGKVDKIDGKGLSTNDYTTAEKTKLGGIEDGAEVNDPNTVVDANYVHTDNNYTSEEKTKLAGLSNYDDTEIKADIDALEAGKQDELTAGDNITIVNNVISAEGGATWGGITGTLANQTDLKNALDAKPTIQVTNVDPGEGQPIAENTFIAVY